MMITTQIYPELKANELVMRQMDVYTANNDKIRQLKEEDLCDGVHIMAIGAEENVPAILDEAGL